MGTSAARKFSLEKLTSVNLIVEGLQHSKWSQIHFDPRGSHENGLYTSVSGQPTNDMLNIPVMPK